MVWEVAEGSVLLSTVVPTELMAELRPVGAGEGQPPAEGATLLQVVLITYSSS